MVAELCPDLKYLAIRNIVGVTEELADKLRKEYAGLEVVHQYPMRMEYGEWVRMDTVPSSYY